MSVEGCVVDWSEGLGDGLFSGETGFYGAWTWLGRWSLCRQQNEIKDRRKTRPRTAFYPARRTRKPQLDARGPGEARIREPEWHQTNGHRRSSHNLLSFGNSIDTNRFEFVDPYTPSFLLLLLACLRFVSTLFATTTTLYCPSSGWHFRHRQTLPQLLHRHHLLHRSTHTDHRL